MAGSIFEYNSSTMAVQVSDKVILITESSELVQPVRDVLAENGLSLASEQLSLHSLPAIRSQVKNSGKTTVIREELKKFIDGKGFPYLIAMDARIDSGLPLEKDPDRLMVFKTILFTLIVLSKNLRYKNLRTSILLLADSGDMEYIKELTLKPMSILDLFVVRDAKISKLIHEYKKNIYSFSNRFSIDSMERDVEVEEFISSLNRHIASLKNREDLDRVKTMGSSLDSRDYDAAHVIYRIDYDRVYIDGTVRPLDSPDFEAYKTGALYIRGYWTNRTHLEVSKKLTSAILKGINDEISFSRKDTIDVYIDKECTVDGATPMSIAGLLSKELKDYPGIRFHANKENFLLLSRAPGFSLIKKNVVRID